MALQVRDAAPPLPDVVAGAVAVAPSVGADHTEPGAASYTVAVHCAQPFAAAEPAYTREAAPAVEEASADIAGERAFVDKEERAPPHFCREMPAEEVPQRYHHSSPE